MLRGLVMVLMVLDHARDYFGNFYVNPTDPSTTTTALFATRWVTHFCAPVFVFLAGTSAWLYGSRGRSTGEVSRFLWTRGLWLVVLEYTLMKFAWTFSIWPAIGIWFQQVIAAIGVGMIALAGLVWLSRRAIATVGFVIVFGHDLLGPIDSVDLGAFEVPWAILLEQNQWHVGNGQFYFVLYPLLPWIGVIALGYAFAPWLQLDRDTLRRRTTLIGVAAIALFVVLRLTDVYGDPSTFRTQTDPARTAIAFLNCGKYPPSLCFLLMTLGPALFLLGRLDDARTAFGRVLVTIGRVPLFFYVVHIALLNFASMAFHRIAYGTWFSSVGDGVPRLITGQGLPEWYGQPLWVVYVAWLATVVLLVPACRWYAGVKRRGRSALWSYL